ncbi:uncharacterized protein EI97DRAFT_437685 [Westerdykella ornata]|uniref:Uncharacterized protein n=1 Tax=Westerdykella ornata TaxID=318751 RepID=A0A6A6J8P5_WESOR|nr:uncharacterized protein EI97DRAFT_437685 [Westerdykella ornata]KAF2271579.1 hypothetical protein EI97DRAFT_437685 [Westerdykella ornata]
MLDLLTAKHSHEYSPQSRPDPSPSGHVFSLPQMPFHIFNSLLPNHPSSSPSVPELASPPLRSLETPPSINLMTSELGTPAYSSPSASRPASVSSTASFDGKPKKKTHRPRTTYNLAQPPPIAGPRHKLHLRPKVLLQLHQVIPGRRPKPVYEVIPFSLLAPRSTRRLARTFNTKERLGPQDLLVVKAEAYENISDEERSDDERWGTREVVGIICPARRADKDPGDKTELLLDDGTSWEVTNMPNGGYEFSFTDEHGLTLKRRWVPKMPHSRRVSTMANTPHSPVSPALAQEDRKFNFSTISPNSRRHPIIGSISRTSIDVLDAYTIPPATTTSTPGLAQSPFATPLPTPASVPESVSFLDKSTELPLATTDDALRIFMVLSGIWVAFSENWSPAYSSSKHLACTPTACRPVPNRAVSMSFVDTPRSASPASTGEDNRRTSLPRLFRSTGQKPPNGHSTPASIANSPGSATTTPSSTQPALKTRSRRANSTGNAELISKNGASRKRYGLAFEDQSLPETEEERQSKRSIELLRMKELARTTPPVPAPPFPSSDNGLAPPTHSLQPLNGDEPSRDPSPVPRAEKTRKTQSAYNPITTKGLWDSEVVDGPGGKKRRPTSLVVLKSKKEKEQKKNKKQEKGKRREKEREKENDKGREVSPKSSGGLRRLWGLFHRHKE